MLRFILLLATFYLTAVSLLAQQPLYVGEMQHYRLPKLLAYNNPKNIEGTATADKNASQNGFYPIGFSRDYRFAYLIDYAATVGCDTHHVELVVQNLVFNEVVWSWRGHYYGVPSAQTKPVKNDHLAALWDGRYTKIRRSLSEYHIHQPEDSELLWLAGGNFKRKEQLFTLKSGVETSKKQPAAKITMSCAKGSRVLYIKNNTEYELDKVQIHGSFISEYDERAAVLVELIFKGDTVLQPKRQLRMVGFDLINNFE